MRILVPIDGSAESRRLIAFLGSRDALLGDAPEIELLNVQTGPSEGLARVFGEEAVRAAYEEEGRKVFDLVRPDLEAEGIVAKEVVRIGEAGEAVAREAEDFGADLVVIGSRGLNPFKGFFLGSFTNAVLSRLKKPVLIIREGTQVAKGGMRVGVAVDGSVYGRAAVDYVLEHRKLFGEGATFDLITVTEGPSTIMNAAPELPGGGSASIIKGHHTIAEELSAEVFAPIEARFRAAGIECGKHAMTGDAADAISRYADAHLDMLVMGSHGRGNFSAAVLGSVAMKVTARTKLPVLVIRR